MPTPGKLLQAQLKLSQLLMLYVSKLNSLQLIQDAAAQVLTGISKRDHISPVLASLRRLPIRFQIKFRILLLAYKVLNCQALHYLQDLIMPFAPNRALI